MDLSHLPDDVREKLAELELELSEGELQVDCWFRFLAQILTRMIENVYR